MGQIEWAMWANEQGVASAFILLLGGVVGVAGMFDKWVFGIAGILIGLFVLMIEWPRSVRSKGSTIERTFQKPFTVILDKMGIAGRNYFIRFVAYLLLCVPCCFIVSTLMGGVCLLVTSLIYFVAAMRGEEWKPSGLNPARKESKKRARSLHPPRKPPPRNPGQTEGAAEGGISHDNIAMEIVDDREAPATRGPKIPTRPPPRPKTAAIRDPIQETS